MAKKQSEFALREMRSELNGFLRFLTTCKIMDDAGATFGIGDALSASKMADGALKWGYTSGKVSLRLDTCSIVSPPQTKSLNCSLDIAVEGEIREANGGGAQSGWIITKTEMDLEFSAESDMMGSGWSQFWHLDTHIDKPPAKIPDEPHPMFHLHFGGNRMASRRLENNGCWGRVLEMHGPRFAHPPMDLILALDFILANATGAGWRDKLCKNKEYNSAVCNSQRRFWKPYKETLVDFYNCNRLAQDKHLARLLWPTLRVKEV